MVEMLIMLIEFGDGKSTFFGIIVQKGHLSTKLGT